MSGNAVLAGTLKITLTNGFSPTAGNSFDILDWGSLSGTFSSLNLPALDPLLTWNTSQLYTTGALSVVGPPALFTADFDEDGDVDAADLAQWQGDFRANEFSDADGDDFLAWQQQLGSGPEAVSSARPSSPQASTTAAVVPEPASLLLISLAALAIPRRRSTYARELIARRL